MYEPGFNIDLAFCDMYIRLTIPQRSNPHSVCLEPRVKEETMAAVKKEQSNILPTDEEPIASSHPDFSKALLHNCEDFLLTILATPRDYNRFMKENSLDIAAFRLLARVDHSEMAFVNTTESRSHHRQEVLTCIWNIKRSIRPRHYLRRLLNVVKTAKDPADKDKP